MVFQRHKLEEESRSSHATATRFSEPTVRRLVGSFRQRHLYQGTRSSKLPRGESRPAFFLYVIHSLVHYRETAQGSAFNCAILHHSQHHEARKRWCGKNPLGRRNFVLALPRTIDRWRHVDEGLQALKLRRPALHRLRNGSL